MNKICFFDTKPYDKVYFDTFKEKFDIEIDYFESKLNVDTAVMANGYEAVVAFVNDTIDTKTIDILYKGGVRIIAMRCAGYNNIDFKAAYDRIHVVRVPAYSPYAVAEHAMALLLTLNRKIHRAYNRTKEHNFSLVGLTGFDLHGKTMGVVGTGKIGRIFIDICKGFGMEVIAYDPYPAKDTDIQYVSFEELCKRSDIISLHCPLTKDTHHLIQKDALTIMKPGVVIINTSRGALINSEDLLNAIKEEKVGGAGLDVYEEETEFFYEDLSYSIMRDDILSGLISMPNVIVTSHQAFLTKEALSNIAEVTLQNLKDYFDGNGLENEICYQCTKQNHCDKNPHNRCF
ncbi:2-hydroxyacid dehydrogenase [Anaerocolumna cellulosilytica]|uniref:2-hydroxyacid dehydrogenase n=1 Tax=Anaerocolumna cellulosilytica TaxID=433286 RepID=A0A6S6R1W4_9FIRM|nr:2-hydroxyacid dehydrogenase [Anaerocolumna cellulosilytica]MBB5195066.1 D-lactate dehydrogenase [Anaerocolumna cellulosilytica]BCJ96096.1 2-hydroxyacid dehydrogenase [Anaerocolumna cellulosilytica]